MKKLLAQAQTELEIALLDIKKFSAIRSKTGRRVRAKEIKIFK